MRFARSLLLITVMTGVATPAPGVTVELVEFPVSLEAITDSPELATARYYGLRVDSMGENLLSIEANIAPPANTTIYNHPNETPNNGIVGAAFLNLAPFRGLQNDSWFNVWATQGGGSVNPFILSGSLNPLTNPIQLGSPQPPIPQDFFVLQFTLLNAVNVPASVRVTGSAFTEEPGGGVRETPFNLVPEPGALALLGVGLVGLGRRRRCAATTR